MEFTATHDFDRPLDEVAAMFLDPDAHVGRYALMGHRDIEVLHVDRGDGCLDLIMSVLVGPQLGHDRLTFIYDYPSSQAALAQARGQVASRFEAYMNGIELANGFHELGDAPDAFMAEHHRARQVDLAQRVVIVGAAHTGHLHRDPDLPGPRGWHFGAPYLDRQPRIDHDGSLDRTHHRIPRTRPETDSWSTE